jgi:hypothetical protein
MPVVFLGGSSMRLRPLFSAAAVVALGAALVIAPATSAAGTTRYVDDDGKAGPAGCNAGTTAKKTIQGAVDAANDGDTILVCPGTYQEQVVIEGIDGLTIKGVQPWTAQVLSPEGPDLENPFLVIVYESDDVTIQWLRFTSLATEPELAPVAADCGMIQAAIVVMASQDAVIRSNRMGTTGPHTLGACGYEVGVMIGEMAAGTAVAASPAGEVPVFRKASAKVVNNLIRDFQTAGVVSLGLRTRVDIVQNSIQFRHENDSTGCEDTSSASSLAPRKADRLRDRLAAMGPAGPGIPYYGDCFAFGVLDGVGTSGTIRQNEIWSNATVDPIPAGRDSAAYLLAGIAEFLQGDAIEEYTSDELPAQTDAPVIRDNRVRGAIAGVALIGADLVAVRDNIVRGSFVGVFVQGTQDARVSANALREAYAGIWVNDTLLPITGRTSADNVFAANSIPGSTYLEWSCDDDTSGTGTAGTANTWKNNTAPDDSSDPSGICGAAVP